MLKISITDQIDHRRHLLLGALLTFGALLDGVPREALGNHAHREGQRTEKIQFGGGAGI
jgi:hypothetical protein